jgi:hypothetical protein
MARHKMVNGVRVDFTPEEEAARDAEEAAWAAGAYDRAMVELRSRRNQLLASSDWSALQDVSLTDEMRDYRKALRDLPTGLRTADDVASVDWPTAP